MTVDGVGSVAVVDFWKSHDPFVDPIVQKFVDRGLHLRDSVRQANVTIASVFGRRHWRARGRVVMFSGESRFRDQFADYTVDCRFLERPNHLRLPLWAYATLNAESSDLAPAEVTKPERFCNFVYSNPRGTIRNSFFEMLHAKKSVDSMGSFMQNRVESRLVRRIDSDWMSSKREVLRDYRFTIAFESREFPGYTTEKILDAWLSGSVPIYWGNPLMATEFPEGSCLSLYEAGSLSRLVEQVLEAEHEPERYAELQMANPFRTGAAQAKLREYAENLGQFVDKVVGEGFQNRRGLFEGTGARLSAKSKRARRFGPRVMKKLRRP
jgi:hypothetical protein